MKKIALLIVEDDSAQANLLYEILSQDYEVVDVCLNGIDALKKIKCNTYNLIIIDLGMPAMSGKELIKKLRTKHCQTPILVYSGRIEENEDFLSVSNLYYLQKPQTSYSLRAAIEAILSHSG